MKISLTPTTLKILEFVYTVVFLYGAFFLNKRKIQNLRNVSIVNKLAKKHARKECEILLFKGRLNRLMIDEN